MMSAQTLFTITLLVCFTLSAARLGLYDSPLFEATHQTMRAEKRADTCKSYSCGQPGASCTDSETRAILCIHNSSCIDNICATDPKKGTVDSSCSSNTDCYEPAACVNSKCNLHYSPGTPCKIDSQCAYLDAQGNNIASCSNGRCAGLNKGDRCVDSDSCFPPLACGPNNTCITPQNVGSYCSDDQHCIKSLICINDTCASPLADGTECMPRGNDFCSAISTCTPINLAGSLGKCVPLYTQAAGAFCSASYMCGEGLTCSDTGSTCTKRDSSSSLKDCDLTAANSTSSCNAGEICGCNGNTGKGTCSFRESSTNEPGNPVGIRKALTDAYSCTEQCLRTDQACLASKCGTQICKYIDVVYRDYNRVSLNQIPSCAKDQFFNGDHEVFYGYLSCKFSAAGNIQYSLVLVLFALVALML